MLPKISIITPSYNQGHFIEETIQSVLHQNYPNLEYIVIDGGSTDNTVNIIRKYESQIAYWISESDRGQANAINKGIAKATGDILAYLNSDDYYLPGTLHKVAEYFCQYPQTDLLHGQCRYINAEGKKIGEQLGSIVSFEEIVDLWGIWWKSRQFVQPEVFWSRRITDHIGLFREDLYYAMDYEYWCRILLEGGKIIRINDELSCFRFTDNQKSNQSEEVADELKNIIYPWLWDKTIDLHRWKRLELQVKWIYDAVFLKEIAKSVQNGEGKASRYLKSLKLLLQYPHILLAPQFYNKVLKSLQTL